MRQDGAAIRELSKFAGRGQMWLDRPGCPIIDLSVSHDSQAVAVQANQPMRHQVLFHSSSSLWLPSPSLSSRVFDSIILYSSLLSSVVQALLHDIDALERLSRLLSAIPLGFSFLSGP